MHSKTRTVQIANSQNIGNFLNIHKRRCLGSVGRRLLNAASIKSLEIQAYSIVKPKILYLKNCLTALIPHESKDLIEKGPPLFITCLSLTCYISVPSFIYNLC